MDGLNGVVDSGLLRFTVGADVFGGIAGDGNVLGSRAETAIGATVCWFVRMSGLK
jgi:hypothetical protein